LTKARGLRDGQYSAELHHNTHLSVGVPGTVAGLHLAWKEQGKLSWKRLVDPAVALARDGFAVSEGLARSLRTQPDQTDRASAGLPIRLVGACFSSRSMKSVT
jgi:gamma-glutamyltranspeptidase/glutathione hydrolase